jgi:hypothetical protein
MPQQHTLVNKTKMKLSLLFSLCFLSTFSLLNKNINTSTPVFSVVHNQLNKLLLPSTPTYSFMVSDYEYGWSIAPAGDVNRDGYADVLIRSSANAYCYLGSATGITSNNSWSVSCDFLYGHETDVNSAGDVNGDGFSDVIIGGRANARIFYGSASGLPATASWTVQLSTGGMNDMFFGNQVAPGGDVNKDGFDDVMVGDYETVHVYYGSASGAATTASWTVNGHFPFSGAGDVNKDGYSDVLIGNQLYYGSASGLQSTPGWTYTAFIPDYVAAAGDVNGDGYSDILFGGGNKAMAFYGSTNGLSMTPGWVGQNFPYTSSFFGRVLSSAGDVNKDGYSDVIISDYMYNNRQVTSWGNAFIFYGSPTRLRSSSNWKAQGGRTCLCTVNSNFAWAVSGAGDVNGDGYSDVMISEPQYYYNENGPKTGAVYFYHGDSILGAPVLLPLKWISFTATAVNMDVLLDWQIMGEENNNRFEVERSRDGIVFTKTITIPSEYTKTHYLYTDKNPGAGKWYYRLKQVNQDARFSYSDIRMIEIRCESFKFFVNVAAKIIEVTIPPGLNAGKPIIADLFTISGQRSRQWRQLSSDHMQFYYGTVAKGTYILRLKMNGAVFSKHIVL